MVEEEIASADFQHNSATGEVFGTSGWYCPIILDDPACIDVTAHLPGAKDNASAPPLIVAIKTERPQASETSAPLLATASERLNAPDTLSRQGAMALAKRLERYWHDQGYPAARFWAEPIEERFEKLGTCELYRIKSNLVKGLPPR